MSLKEQMQSVLQWEHPTPNQLFYKLTSKGDELKNASKLILQPGQGCIFTYEGKIKGVFDTEGIYDIHTNNTPFFTTLTKFLKAFESEHKTGIWFYRKAELFNIRWGTRIPITYTDPQYKFPVNLRAYGNYSLKITNASDFFTSVLAGQPSYEVHQLQEVMLSRISQPIASYLANAKFSYAELDSYLETIAKEVQVKTDSIFTSMGFALTDFRIEGSSFDADTNARIAEISNVQADVNAAGIAGVDYKELQQLKAMRDAAKNEGAAGAGLGLLAGMQMGNQMQNNLRQPHVDISTKLKGLKQLFQDELITEEEYIYKKKQLLDSI